MNEKESLEARMIDRLRRMEVRHAKRLDYLKMKKLRKLSNRGKDERKLFSIRLGKDEYEALTKAKKRGNLPMKDSDIAKLFLMRYLGGNHE